MPINYDGCIRPGAGRDLTEKILEAKTAHPDWSIRRLGDELGIPKSNVHRILQKEQSEPEHDPGEAVNPLEGCAAPVPENNVVLAPESRCPAAGCPPMADEAPKTEDYSNDWVGAAICIGLGTVIGGTIVYTYREQIWDSIKGCSDWVQGLLGQTLTPAKMVKTPVPTMMGNLGQAPASRRGRYSVSG